MKIYVANINDFFFFECTSAIKFKQNSLISHTNLILRAFLVTSFDTIIN